MSLGQGKIIGLAGSAEYNVIMLIRALAKKDDSYHWKMIKHKSSEYPFLDGEKSACQSFHGPLKCTS